ncbi:MAG: baseplate J/gp47 family protein, partial [Pseudomonadota bacterium]|nr:baseplate J/gp47 family protein [Pseudomonadota bacterium]
MTTLNRIDLASLPLPDVVTTLDFEALVNGMKAELIAEVPALAEALSLQSEPLVKLLEQIAYRELHQTNRVNQTAKALLLAYATGTTLDHIGVTRDVERLLITPANPNSSPPTEDVYETDDAYRRRIQLAPERYAAGSIGAYVYWALSADGAVRDANPVTPTAGVVRLYIQSHQQDVAGTSLLATVAATLNTGSRRPFTDDLQVLAAEPFDFVIDAELTLFPWPDKSVVLANANAALDRYLDQISYLGYDATLSGLHAALHQAG